VYLVVDRLGFGLGRRVEFHQSLFLLLLFCRCIQEEGLNLDAS
jgi:hypothetical protein